MLENKLVSIIVPIYKVEPYLKKCIESIICQTYKNIEIILVDDGSPDNSGEICDRYSQIDNRIIVIHKQNDGVSNARNSGMEISHGKYIYFIDGDDYVEKDAIEKLVYLAELEKADLVIADINIVDESGDILASTGTINNANKYQVLSPQRAVKDFVESDWGPWNKLYSRHVHIDVKFPSHKIHEDEAIMLQLFHNCHKVVYTNQRLYNYLKRAGSTTGSSYSVKKIDWFDAWICNIAFAEKYFPDSKKQSVSKMVVTAIYNLDNLLKRSQSEEMQSIQIIVKAFQTYFADILQNQHLKLIYKIRVILAVFSLDLYRFIYVK